VDWNAQGHPAAMYAHCTSTLHEHACTLTQHTHTAHLHRTNMPCTTFQANARSCTAALLCKGSQNLHFHPHWQRRHPAPHSSLAIQRAHSDTPVRDIALLPHIFEQPHCRLHVSSRGNPHQQPIKGTMSCIKASLQYKSRVQNELGPACCIRLFRQQQQQQQQSPPP